MDYVMDQRMQQQGRGSYNGGHQINNPSSMNRPYLMNDELRSSWRNGMDFCGDRSPLNPVNSSQFMYPKLCLCGCISTRVVQKLVETLKTRQQISLVVLALKPGFLNLIKDLNGNHVIQRCLHCLSKEDNKAADALIQLYHNFITDFETKINLLKLAHFVIIVSRQYPEKEAAVSYLEGVIEKPRATRKMRIEEPILYIKMQIVIFNLEKGTQKECKKLLEDRKSTLDSMTDIDPSVYANYYWVSSQYHILIVVDMFRKLDMHSFGWFKLFV